MVAGTTGGTGGWPEGDEPGAEDGGMDGDGTRDYAARRRELLGVAADLGALSGLYLARQEARERAVAAVGPTARRPSAYRAASAGGRRIGLLLAAIGRRLRRPRPAVPAAGPAVGRGELSTARDGVGAEHARG